MLYRITGETSRAEECAAEAFWRLHSKPPRDSVNLEGWLYRTGVRLALDHLKRERRRARYESLTSFFRQPPTPEQAVELSEERRKVRRALACLNAGQVSLILLRTEGRSYAEIAELLNLKPASVGTMLARAEAAFRKEYVNLYGKP